MNGACVTVMERSQVHYMPQCCLICDIIKICFSYLTFRRNSDPVFSIHIFLKLWFYWCFIRQPLMVGKTLSDTTCHWTSALRRWRTRMGTPLERAACGPWIQPKWRRCRRSFTSGDVKTLSLYAAAWPDQVCTESCCMGIFLIFLAKLG